MEKQLNVILKLYLSLLFLLSFLLLPQNSNSQITFNIINNGFDLNRIQFIGQTGFAVGSNGVVMKTTNENTGWKISYIGQSNDYFWYCDFVNESTGWACGNLGKIIRTTNGGNSWTLQNSNTYQTLINLKFVDLQTGWAIGHGGIIRKTTNGGNDWFPQNSSTSINLFNSDFINSTTGWVVGDEGIFKTTNGGNSWFKMLDESWVYSVDFLDSQTGWAGVRFGKILKTTDGGSSWTQQQSNTGATIYSMSFRDANNGIATGDYNQIIRTTNGGVNWIPTSSGINIYDFKFSNVFNDPLNIQTSWISGFSGSLLKSTDSGISWTLKSIGTYYNWYSYFVNTSVGYVVGSEGSIIKTETGGQTWKILNSGTSNTLINTFFVNENTGWVIGHYGTVLKTIDGGTTWIRQNTGTFTNFFNSFFIDENTGWVAGDGGIYKTTNGGTNWNLQLNEPWVYSVFFINENTGWAGVRFGKIFKTTNGGNTWIQKPSGSGATFYSMFFKNEFSGFAVGDYNTIIKTTNGGESWFSQNSRINDPYAKFSCVNFGRTGNDVGWIAGFNGLILGTMDGGNTWVRQNVPFNTDFNSVQHLSDSLLYAAGGFGIVLKSMDARSVAINNISNTLPQDFLLSQNYPNPFNPKTVISYNLPHPDITVLKVYDIMGREIKTLVNEMKDAGRHVIEFDGSGLPSGAYYYKIESGNYTETKMMTLVK